MNNRILNKKGTDKIVSIYWFVMLALVAGGIFAMVYVFYGAPHDVREIESEIFAEKIADCISKQGIIDLEFIKEEKFNEEITEIFVDKCDFNFEVEEGYEGNLMQYFYEVEFFTLKNLEIAEFEFYGGNLNLKADCFVKKDNKKEYFRLAKCTERRFYALDEKNNQYLIKVLTVIGKSEKNVRQT